MGEVVALATSPALGDAVRAFLHSYERIGSDGTRRVYRGTLEQMMAAFGGPQATLAVLDSPADNERFREWFRATYPGLAPRTRARKLATFKSAFGWWRRQGWMVTDPAAGLDKPPIPRDRTRTHTRADIAGLWERDDIPLREKTLWKLLYETAARSEEILGLDIEDLDLPNKRARVRRKGGNIDWVVWQTGAARLLPRLIDGRQRGPVFLASRRPRAAVATVDLCPVTGRARLSYRRAAELLTEHTGWTLHGFRRAALTHDAEQGTSTQMLMRRSGHSSSRSLDPYVQISLDALSRHVAEQDPAARRRT